MSKVQLKNVSKLFPQHHGPIKALDEVDLEIEAGGFVVIRGPSGSGKTTLLFTVGGMLCPTSGHLLVEERDLYRMSSKERAGFRAEKIGFVFQLFYLLPYLNVIDNVLIPVGSLTRKKPGLRKAAESLLDRLNLSDRAGHFPAQLSAGEKQRTAIARALIRKPDIILADEPTGNLDPENSAEIAGCLSEIQAGGCTVIVVTHGESCDAYADRIIRLERGRIRQDIHQTSLRGGRKP